MDAQQAAHPTHDRLKAYGLGKPIDAAAADTIGQHLETCADCRRVVAELPADPFLNQLRAIGNADGTPAPERPVDGLARSITHPRPPSVTTDNTLPPELTDHPNYEVLRELGRGGMGVVYLARNRLMDRPEVLKVMNKDLLNKPGAADRFLREMRSAAKLAHPNVVRAYSADWLGEALMFAMEYVEGNDLAGLVKARGPLPVLNACYYAQQVAAGLQHAFENGMVHRDIKPANLILARAGKKHTVKILDFGLAKMKGEDNGAAELTGAGAMMGTPSYMAPEQWQDAASADIRADIYSLGCTLYCLLTGRPPFEGPWQGLLWKHQKVEPEPLTKVRPEVPEALTAVVARMMAKEPAARYQTPAEVAKALAPFVRPGTAPKLAAVATEPAATSRAPAASATEPNARPDWESLGEVSLVPVAVPAVPRPSRKRPWLWPVVACATVLVAVVIAGAGGVFKARTPNGTIVVENVPADAVVEVDAETVTVTRNGETVTLTALKDGKYRLKVVQGGKELKLNDAEVMVAGEPVRVRVEPNLAGWPRVIPKSESTNHPKSWDGGRFFGKAAWERLSAVSDRLWKENGISLLVETFDVPPTRSADSVRNMKPDEREKYFEGVVRERVKELRLVGVYVLVCRTPTYIYVEIPRESGLPATLHAQLLERLRHAFRQSQFDEGLTVAAQMVLDAHKEPQPTAPNSQGFVPLFNGKDLTGWKANYDPNNDRRLWFVENGVITNDGKNAAELVWTQTDYGDFHLRVEARSSEGEKSAAILFRRVTATPDVASYRAGIGGPLQPPGALAYRRPGGPITSLKAPTPVLPARPGQWCVYDITAKGDQIAISVDGQQVVDYTETGVVSRTGSIVLYVHGGAKVWVRKVEIRAISAAMNSSIPDPPPKTRAIDLGGGEKLELVRIDPAAQPDKGTFQMGSAPATLALIKQKWNDAPQDEPAHECRLTKPYYLGKYEVTRGQFRAFVSATSYRTEAEAGGGGFGWSLAKNNWATGPEYTWRHPGFQQDDAHPVTLVSWNDARRFCTWVQDRARKELGGAVEIRLPTEAEWEYACRAGSTTLFSFGDNIEELAQYGNGAGASDGYARTAPVGAFRPNAFDLHDMHGNVWEWCADWYGEQIYTTGSRIDPTGPSFGQKRVYRGSSWYYYPHTCRSAGRSGRPPGSRLCDLGFRVAATVGQ